MFRNSNPWVKAVQPYTIRVELDDGSAFYLYEDYDYKPDSLMALTARVEARIKALTIIKDGLEFKDAFYPVHRVRKVNIYPTHSDDK